jgi:hypothetical protein
MLTGDAWGSWFVLFQHANMQREPYLLETPAVSNKLECLLRATAVECTHAGLMHPLVALTGPQS